MNSNQISRFKEDFDHFMHEGYMQEIHTLVSELAWIIANDS